jgi:DNA-nicking Smr family endonuclease
MDNWKKEHPDRIKTYARRYREKNRDKIRLHHINRNRAKYGLSPADTIEQHFNDRKQGWFKKLVYGYLRYNDKLDLT